MTLTETRPEQDVDTTPEPVAVAPETWLTTSDHKKLGSVFLGFSLLFLLTGGILALVLRGQLAEGDLIAADTYGRLFNMHATVMTTLFLAPAWVGLATYLVPLQIGSGRVALPRLHAAAFWTYLAGGGLIVASYIVGPVGPPGSAGLSLATPMVANGAANHATLLWIGGLMVLALATIAAAVSILTTVVMLRTDGMTFLRVPAFSWASMITSAILLLSTPVFMAGLVLLFIDERFSGGFFGAGGATAVWMHTLWLLGRPEIYLLTLPGLGAACDMVATHARRGLLSHVGALVMLALFGALSLASWAAGVHTGRAVVLPTYTVGTALVALPIALLVLMWLGTVQQGRVAVLLATGAVNAIVAAFSKVGGPDSAWTTGNLHTVAFGAPTLLLFGAVYHWAPKMWGRSLSVVLGGVTFLLLFGGFFVMGMSSYALGYQGAPAHVEDLINSKYTSFSRLSAAGGVLIALGVIVFIIDLVQSLLRSRGSSAGDDPYDGLTLEWATTSPPPPYDFDNVPEVRSETPLVDLRAARAATNGGGR